MRQAVSSVDAAINSLPPWGPLSATLANLEDATPLYAQRELLVNVSHSLDVAIKGLPSTAAIQASLLAYNRSKTVLPPLIADALAAIDN